MAALDTSIVNVSLPVIKGQFRSQINQVEWVVTAYMISYCVFIPLVNWLKKRIGYFHLYLISVSIFTTGSLLCGLSHGLVTLVGARVFQALGGGAITPTSLAVLSETFPKEKRGTAVGWWGMGNSMGPAIGPPLGGVLTHYFGWQSIFFINIPIGILTVILSLKYLKFLKGQPKSKDPLDAAGYLWFILFIFGIQYGVSLFPGHRIVYPPFLVAATVALLSFFFYLHSSRKEKPLMDLTVFRSRDFMYSAIVTVFRAIAQFAGIFFLPFLLMGLMGYKELQAGLLLLPNALAMLAARPYSGRRSDEGHIRNLCLAGIILLAISFFFFSRLNKGDSIWLIVLPMLLRGFGVGLLSAPISTSLLNSARTDQAPTATSMNSFLMQIGGSLGIAVSGVIHDVLHAHYLQKHYPDLLSEHYALQDGFLVAACICLIAVWPALKLPNSIRPSNTGNTNH